MKPVHWGLVLVVMAGCMVAVSSLYLSETDMTEGASYAVDAYPGGELPVLIDVTGLLRPDFSLPDISGAQRHISEWDGKVITINFWATWCLPCLKEVPLLVDLQSEYGDDGFQVIGIALQKPEDVMDFIRDNNVNYPILAAEMEVIPVAEAYGNQLAALPYTAIIDREGEIVYTKHGAVTRAEVVAVISPLL